MVKNFRVIVYENSIFNFFFKLILFPSLTIPAYSEENFDELLSHPLSLKQSIQIALSHNKQYLNIQDQISVSKLDMDTARSEFRMKFTPSVSTDARLGTDIGQRYNFNVQRKFQTGSRLDINAGSTTFSGETLSEVNVQITQPLLKGMGKLVNTTRLAQAERTGEKRVSLKEIAKEELIFNIITAYYQIVKQGKLIEVHEKSLERAKKLLEAARAKLKVGMVSKMDVFRADIQVSQAEDSLEDAKSAYERAKDNFKILLGAPPALTLDIIPEIDYKEITFDFDESKKTALGNRLELKELKKDIDFAWRNVEVARKSLLPPLNITLKYSQLGRGSSFNESIDLNETRFGVGLSATTDFTLTQERANHQKALIVVKNKQRDYEQAKDKIINEVKESVRFIKRGLKKIELRNKRIEDAENQLKFAMIRYKKGLIDNLTVIDAEKELVLTRTSQISAVVDYIVAVNRLYRATGDLRKEWVEN